MVERLVAPVWDLISREDLAKYKVDVAAVDAIMNGQEKVKVMYGKANEAVTEVKELMVKAGVPPRISEGQEESAEGSEEEEKRSKEGAVSKGAPRNEKNVGIWACLPSFLPFFAPQNNIVFVAIAMKLAMHVHSNRFASALQGLCQLDNTKTQTKC